MDDDAGRLNQAGVELVLLFRSRVRRILRPGGDFYVGIRLASGKPRGLTDRIGHFRSRLRKRPSKKT